VAQHQVEQAGPVVGVHGPLGDAAVVGGKAVTATDPLFLALAQQVARGDAVGEQGEGERQQQRPERDG